MHIIWKIFYEIFRRVKSKSQESTENFFVSSRSSNIPIFIRQNEFFQDTATMHHEEFIGTNHRQIMNIRNLEVCKLTKMISQMGYWRIKGLIWVTFYSVEHNTFKKIDNSRLPNGNYKLKIHTFNDQDNTIGEFTIFWDILPTKQLSVEWQILMIEIQGQRKFVP